MVSLQKVDEQLKQIGVNYQFWGRRELRELSKIMTPTEQIKHAVNGHYSGGFAMLVATDQRLLLIDGKPLFLTVEAIWYDKIGQVDFNHRWLNATICVSTPNKELYFTSWNNIRLREIMLYTQEKMNEAKAYFHAQYQHFQEQQLYGQVPQMQGSFQEPSHQPQQPDKNWVNQGKNDQQSDNYHRTALRGVGAQWRKDAQPVQFFASETAQSQEQPTYRLDESSRAIRISRNRLPFSRRRYFSSEVA